MIEATSCGGVVIYRGKIDVYKRQDQYGLDKIDRRILKTLIVNFKGGPVGLETLAAAIGEDSGTLEDVYEPYLLQNGFLNRTPRGRMASPLAYSHLGYEKIS